MKPIVNFLLICLLGTYHCGISQMNPQRQIDSLSEILRTSSIDTTTARVSLEISEIWVGSSNDSVIKYCNISLAAMKRVSAESLAKNNARLLSIKASALNNLGYAWLRIGDQVKGLEYYEQSLSIRERIGVKDDIANSLNNIAIVYDEQGNSPKALDYYLKALKLLEETDEKMGMGYVLNNIASVYKFTGNMEKALEYNKKALK